MAVDISHHDRVAVVAAVAFIYSSFSFVPASLITLIHKIPAENSRDIYYSPPRVALFILLQMARWAALALMVVALSTTADSVNHTVGGAAGWVFNTSINKAIIDYSLWASKITFFTGDYLSGILLLSMKQRSFSFI